MPSQEGIRDQPYRRGMFPRPTHQMSRATPQMRDLSQRIILHETEGNRSSKTKIPAAFLVCQKLRPHLATLMGNVGFRALLSRALALATQEGPLLRGVRIKGDGSLGGLEESKAQVEAQAVAEGGVVLVAQLLGLLMAFVGANLTLRMVREVWPRLSLNDWDSGKEVKNEKARL